VPLGTAAGSYTNTVSVSSDTPDDPQGDPNTAEDTNTVGEFADLTVTKDDGVTTVTAGDGVTYTYTITVSNNGPSDAENVVVTDTWPAGFDQTVVGPPSQGSITLGVGGNFTWNVGAIAANAFETLTVSYTVPLGTAAGSYTNTVSVSSDTPDDPQGDPNTVADTNTVIVVTDLQIIKTSGTTTVAPGGPVTYTIFVTNAGPSDAIGARVIDMFPPTLIDVSYTSTVTGTVSGNTALGFGNIDDTVNMTVGSTITYTATATLSASATGTLTNIATVIPGPGADDPNVGDNADSGLIPIRSPGLIVVSPDKGNASQPWIHVVSRDTGELVVRFLAFEARYLGGVRVATGDLTGDGIPEIVAVRGRNSTSDVRIFDLDGNLLKELRVFPASFIGGVDIAVGDVDGDGRNDLVAGMSFLGSQVVIFRNTTALAPDSPLTFEQDKSFYPFGASFIGGVVVAVADMGELQGTTFLANLDGRAEIIVGNEAGMRSTVKVFDYGTLQAVRTFYPFTSAFIGGISLDVARVNGDLIPDLIVGTGPTGGSNVEVLDGTLPPKSTLLSFVAYSAAETSSHNAPVRVAAVDDDGDGWADVIVTAQGTNGSTGIIKVFGVTAPAQLVGQFPGNLPDPSDFGGAYFVSDVTIAISTASVGGEESPLASASWTNPTLAVDVNGDGTVTALDALLVINDLNATGPRFLTGSPSGGYFPDVDNSGRLEPLDVLGVIQYLNSPQSTGGGEGESEDFASPDPLSARNWGGLGATAWDARPVRSALLKVEPLASVRSESRAADLVFASLVDDGAMSTLAPYAPLKRAFKAAAGQAPEDGRSWDWDPDRSAIADDVCRAWEFGGP